MNPKMPAMRPVSSGLVVLLHLPHRAWADVGGVSGPVRDLSGAPAQQLFLTIWATRPNKPRPATTNGNLCSQSLRLGVTYWRSNFPASGHHTRRLG